MLEYRVPRSLERVRSKGQLVDSIDQTSRRSKGDSRGLRTALSYQLEGRERPKGYRAGGVPRGR